MIVDNCTIRGSSHEICEDSSLSYIDDRATGIICDGCSSEENTHLGSSIIMYSAKKFLSKNLFGLLLVMNKASEVCETLGINDNCLYSTLLVMKELSGIVELSMYGDGVIIYKYKDMKELEYIKFEYTHNAPLYPIYYFREDLYKKYLEYSKNEFRIEIVSELKQELKLPISKNLYINKNVPKDNLEFIAIMSDGIFSFFDEKNRSCVFSDKELFNKLFDFKLVNKNFIKRRLKRFVQDMSKEGYTNFDDVSVVIFHEEIDMGDHSSVG